MRHCFEQKYFRNWKIKFSWKLLKQEPSRGSSFLPKGGLISEDILTLVPLPKRGAKCLPWGGILNKLFTVKFGLSEKHTKFEKIFLMVLTSQLLYLVNVKTTRKIFSNYVCFSESLNFKWQEIKTFWSVERCGTFCWQWDQSQNTFWD